MPSKKERITASVIEDKGTEAAEECTVPRFGGPAIYDFPKSQADTFTSLIKEYTAISSRQSQDPQHWLNTTFQLLVHPPEYRHGAYQHTM